jgi:hypothetical protein
MSAKEISLPADVVSKIASDFPNEPLATIFALLDDYRGVERLRVIRCVIHLAEGNTDKLLEFIGSARTDYRDVIYWAEYDDRDQKVRDFSQPFSVAPADPGEVSLSFIGGRPFLAASAGIPTCALCSARMCFLFQVALPVGHPWQGALVAMFMCISCCSEDSLIPEMLSVALKGAEIPQGFLTRYQTNFRILVSDIKSAQLRTDYDPLIEQSLIDLASWRIGAEPLWLVDDETPGSYESFKHPAFLFQVPPGMTFPKLSGAPPQKTLDLAGNVVDEDRPSYELFLGNASYFFGFGESSAERTYVVTQVN